jgi:putative CocE/NonD family hydrolase
VPYVVLYAASDAVDTDFAAVLTDVFPDGRSIRVAENILRASYRDSLSNPKPIEPGKVYRYKIELNGISLVFKKGHRIRVDVMSARFPTWSRNPNTGAPEGYDAETITAHQTLHHNDMHPSHILLPVIPS